MSTRSGIGIRIAPDTVKYIYCHHDGYISYNGEILFNYYKTANKVRQLIALGSLSVLGEQIGEKTDFNYHADGQCVAYGRDRGEEGVEAKTMSIDDFRQYEEYNYLFDEGTWFVSCGETYYQFEPLADFVEGYDANVSGGMNPSAQEVEDFFTGASTSIRAGRKIQASRRPNWIQAAKDEEIVDPRIDQADELSARVEDDFDYVMTGIERLGREGMLDEALDLLNTLADTLDSAVAIIGDDFEQGTDITEEI